MWLRRLFRRRSKPPPLDLSALDGLEGLIARVIALLPEVGTPRPEELPESTPAPSEEVVAGVVNEPAPDAYLLFLPGYELVECAGPPPPQGGRLVRDARGYRVLRHGPSPLPGDRRRCVFLERT
ncbi:MAG TPA: hypothetical protein VNI55_01175 [Gaiellaceae bacterium]|nr:hypothetical protein [Gaiellaceae bacterium]